MPNAPSACFVDTNVFLYAQDPRDLVKQGKARTWLAALSDRNIIVISPQVMNEFASVTLRKFAGITPDQLQDFLTEMQFMCTARLTAATSIYGLHLHRRYGFSFYDCVLIASAVDRGCDILLSEDLAHDQQIDGLRIINPFLVAPTELLTS